MHPRRSPGVIASPSRGSARASRGFIPRRCCFGRARFALWFAVVSGEGISVGVLFPQFRRLRDIDYQQLLLDDTADMVGEKSALSNINSLRSYEVIDKMKEALEKACPAVVSCADIVIMAARDAVFLSGGPYWEVKLGRLDSLRASKEASDDIMRADVGLLITLFSRFNLSIKDLVSLSVSHSIGKGRFDNRYYKVLVDGKGLDQTLFTHDETRGCLEIYSQNQGLFFQDFVEGMVKLGDLQGEGGGEIRRNYRVANGSPGYLLHTDL